MAKKHIQDLIGRIYDGTIDDAVWTGIANELAQIFSATSAVLKLQDMQENVQLVDMTANLLVDPKQQDWAAYWHKHDLWVEKSLAFGMSKIVTSQDLVPESELRKTGFYGDWIRHLDIFHMMGAVFPAGGDTVGVLGIHRPEKARPFSTADSRLFSTLMPHLIRAFQLRRQFAQLRNTTEVAYEILDRTGQAAIVLDAERKVVFANKHAALLMGECNGVDVRNGRFSILNTESDERLGNLVRQCILTLAEGLGTAGGGIYIQRKDRIPMILSVAPLRRSPDMGNRSATALVFIRDPEEHCAARQMLRDLFGLTPTEAAVAAALADGRAPSEIARNFGIGLGTVRSHLKQAMQKTGTRKQAQLATLILRCGLPS